MSGVTPTVAASLATKGYVDGAIVTDHGGLTGLSDDDHTQYILVDGTRAFTGVVSGITPTLAAHLATKGYVDGAIISDHGGLGGLGDDDHTQYSLVSGTRAFTGTVGGVTPVASSDLATKGYVDGLGGDFSGLTDGSVVFVSSGAAAEDNDQLYWDDSTDVLVIGDNDGGDTTFNDGGGPLALSNNLVVRNADDTALEAQFARFSSVAGSPSNFALSRARGSIATPASINAGDSLGAIVGLAFDGTDWEQLAQIRIESGAATTDGQIKLLTRTGSTLADVFGCHEDGYVVVGDLDSVTPNLADGQGDLAVGADLDVIGQTRLQDEVGWRTAPESASAIVASYTDSSIIAFMRIDKTTTYAGSAPAAGINVLNFSLTDEASANTTYRAVRHSAEYNRSSHPSSHTLTCVEIIRYGALENRAINSVSSTFDWTGFRINQTVPGSDSNITAGTFNFIDFRTTKFDYDAWPNVYSNTTDTLTHYSARLGGRVLIEEDDKRRSASTHTTSDGMAASIELDPLYAKHTGDGASTRWTITRHNYIQMNDVDDSGATGFGLGGVTDACVIRFDAAAGTHKAVDGSSTKASPGNWDAAVKFNINGTIYYGPLYTSRTS